MERALALRYAEPGGRPALAALLALDERLGQVLRGTREPIVGQMRLTWWHAALSALDTAPPPAEPVLAALAAAVRPRGVTGAELAGLVDGWEVLLEDGAQIDAAALARFAAGRGGRLFVLAGRALGIEGTGKPAEGLEAAGEGWALADLARHLSDPAGAALASAAARSRLAAISARPWPRRARPLGALALLARADLAGTPPGAPSRVGRLLLHRLTGR